MAQAAWLHLGEPDSFLPMLASLAEPAGRGIVVECGTIPALYYSQGAAAITIPKVLRRVQLEFSTVRGAPESSLDSSCRGTPADLTDEEALQNMLALDLDVDARAPRE